MNVNLKTEITKDDLNKLKLTCGIEIHQQLEGKKLFCNCPTTIRDDNADFTVKRMLRASAGESGIVDIAAKAEQKKQKYFLYEGYNSTTCLVETDEEPPHNVNKDALNASLQMAKFLNTSIVDQLRFMRKTVVDGSNTSGFQRTGLVGVNGEINIIKSSGEELRVGIESVCLEEDSAKIVEETSDYKKYNLSRLGIPLIEIATAPDMHDPDDVKLVAEHIGMLLRSLPNVKRGLGTIRQDVNVSISEGLRVEIKGAQDLRMIPAIVKNEMLRQYNLLRIYDELKKRNASVGKEIIDVSGVFKSTSSKVILNGLTMSEGVVLALSLKGFAGVLGLEIQPGRRYGTELSDYAKTMGVKGLFHSDELPNYGITEEEKNMIYESLHLDKTKDAFILIASSESIARRALSVAKERAEKFELLKEVRNARPDGSSTYMRPMPGSSRMYPETDVPTEEIHQEKIILPKRLDEQIKDLVNEFGLAEDIAKKLLRDNIDLRKQVFNFKNLNPKFILDVYYSIPQQIKKLYGVEVSLEEMKLFIPIVLERLNDNLVTKDSLPELFYKLHNKEEINYDDYKPLSIDDVREEIEQFVKESLEKKLPRGAIMGQLMSKYKGRLDGKDLNELLSLLINA
jgi:glutamyl-tRNA(Gln) amidotransferase subunit E